MYSLLIYIACYYTENITTCGVTDRLLLNKVLVGGNTESTKMKAVQIRQQNLFFFPGYSDWPMPTRCQVFVLRLGLA